MNELLCKILDDIKLYKYGKKKGWKLCEINVWKN